jgi:iron complex transport system ATP-binding protein
MRRAIEVTGLSYSYGGEKVLNDVSFHVDAGERVAVIGPNGAGKSTLLKLIAHALDGAVGDILVFGKNISVYRRRDLSARVAYAPQEIEGVFPFTVKEFVMMGRYPHLSPFSSITKRDRDAAHEAMSLAGVQEFAGRALDSLSGGERRRVILCAALCQEADVLLLDEPGAFLDPKAQDDTRAIVSRVSRERGSAVIFVTHDVNIAAMDSQRTLALRGGETVFNGASAELMDSAVLRRVYGKDFSFAERHDTGGPVVVPTFCP